MPRGGAYVILAPGLLLLQGLGHMGLHYYCRVADHIYLPYCFRGWPIWPYITIARYGPYILNLLLQGLGNIFHLTITGAGPYICSSYSSDGLPCPRWNNTSICQHTTNDTIYRTATMYFLTNLYTLTAVLGHFKYQLWQCQQNSLGRGQQN